MLTLTYSLPSFIQRQHVTRAITHSEVKQLVCPAQLDLSVQMLQLAQWNVLQVLMPTIRVSPALLAPRVTGELMITTTSR